MGVCGADPVAVVTGAHLLSPVEEEESAHPAPARPGAEHPDGLLRARDRGAGGRQPDSGAGRRVRGRAARGLRSLDHQCRHRRHRRRRRHDRGLRAPRAPGLRDPPDRRGAAPALQPDGHLPGRLRPVRDDGPVAPRRAVVRRQQDHHVAEHAGDRGRPGAPGGRARHRAAALLRSAGPRDRIPRDGPSPRGLRRVRLRRVRLRRVRLRCARLRRARLRARSASARSASARSASARSASTRSASARSTSTRSASARSVFDAFGFDAFGFKQRGFQSGLRFDRRRHRPHRLRGRNSSRLRPSLAMSYAAEIQRRDVPSRPSSVAGYVPSSTIWSTASSAHPFGGLADRQARIDGDFFGQVEERRQVFDPCSVDSRPMSPPSSSYVQPTPRYPPVRRQPGSHIR